jgi:uncharacterized membrane protein YedE/YeeE
MKRDMDPYVAGVGIGLVLLAAYAVVGRGLGASGGYSSIVAAATVAATGTSGAAASPAIAPYLTDGVMSPLRDWLVLELVGVMLGAFASAWMGGHLQWSVNRPASAPAGWRVAAAVGGGVLMGIGAKFARGCTSGQALSGGALLSAGSWIFIVTCFAAAYVSAPIARRLWS